MRICVSHLTTYRYHTPAGSVIQMLRLTPRNHDGQYVARWRIDVSADCRLDQHEDAFGNITHAFTADGPFTELKVLVEGEVETRDTQGIVRGAVERFPPSLFLRETALTSPTTPSSRSRRTAPAGGRRRHAQAPASGAEPAARRDALRHRSDPAHHHGRGGVRAQARRLPGPHATSSSRPRAASASRRAMSAAISTATTA